MNPYLIGKFKIRIKKGIKAGQMLILIGIA